MSVIIRLQNLPLSANASHIREFFHGLQIPDGGVNIVGGDDGDAFIVFATDDDARRAMLLNDQMINDSRIKLFLSSKQEMQTFITDAQNRVLRKLKNSPDTIDNDSSKLEPPKEKRSFSYFNPDNNLDEPPNKLRIIDYSSGIPETIDYSNDRQPMQTRNYINDEPPRPSAFAYKQPHLYNINHCEARQPQIEMDYIDADNIDLRSEYLERANLNGYERLEREANGLFFNEPREIPDYYDSPDELNHQMSVPDRQNYLYPGSMQQEDYYDQPCPIIHDRYSVERQNGFNQEPHYSDYEQKYPKPDQFPPVHRVRQMRSQSIDKHAPYVKQCIKEPVSVTRQASFAVRMTLPLFLIKPKCIYDIFASISIVQRTGIRIEIDEDERLTGYAYVLFINDVEANKGLRMNNKTFQKANLTIEKCSLVEFDHVRTNDNIVEYGMDTPISMRSPYYKDMSVEMYILPTDVTMDELNAHFDNKLETKKLNFVEHRTRYCCLVNIQEEDKFLYLLSRNNSILKNKELRIVAISRNQFRSILATGKKGFRPAELKSNTNHLKIEHHCIKLDGLRDGTTAATLCNLFSPTAIPLSNIFVRGTEAVMDLVKVETCQKIFDEFSPKTNLEFTLKPISKSAFNTLKSNFINKPIAPSPSVANANAKEATDNAKSKENAPKEVESSLNRCKIIKIRKLPAFIGQSQLSGYIKRFQPSPTSLEMCYNNNRLNGEAILTFSQPAIAASFKSQFDGAKFKQNNLEVIFWDRK